MVGCGRPQGQIRSSLLCHILRAAYIFTHVLHNRIAIILDSWRFFLRLAEVNFVFVIFFKVFKPVQNTEKVICSIICISLNKTFNLFNCSVKNGFYWNDINIMKVFLYCLYYFCFRISLWFLSFLCAPYVSYGTYKSFMVWPFKIRIFFFSPSFKIITLNNVYCLLKNNYIWVYLVRLHYVYISLRLVFPFIRSRPTFYTLSCP